MEAAERSLCWWWYGHRPLPVQSLLLLCAGGCLLVRPWPFLIAAHVLYAAFFVAASASVSERPSPCNLAKMYLKPLVVLGTFCF